jgi:hypothetical protein
MTMILSLMKCLLLYNLSLAQEPQLWVVVTHSLLDRATDLAVRLPPLCLLSFICRTAEDAGIILRTYGTDIMMRTQTPSIPLQGTIRQKTVPMRTNGIEATTTMMRTTHRRIGTNRSTTMRIRVAHHMARDVGPALFSSASTLDGFFANVI